MSLRALRRHGFRAVLATGRSLGEVSDRCLAYGRVGGVAEYGGVVYDATRDESEVLLDDAAHSAFDSLRDTLRQTPGVFIDPDYLHMVRAFLVDRRSRRCRLPQVRAEALARSGCADNVRIPQGFLPDGLSRGWGAQGGWSSPPGTTAGRPQRTTACHGRR